MILPITLALTLLWSFPRSFEPQPDAFIVTYIMASTGQPGEMRTPPSAPGACSTGVDVDPDLYCTQWPTCPAEGEVIFFWAESVWGEQRVRDAAEPPAACQIVAGCACQPIALDPPAEPAPGTPTAETLSPTPDVTLPPLPTFTPVPVQAPT